MALLYVSTDFSVRPRAVRDSGVVEALGYQLHHLLLPWREVGCRRPAFGLQASDYARVEHDHSVYAAADRPHDGGHVGDGLL